MHLQPLAGQLGEHVGLQIAVAQYQVRFQGQDLLVLDAGEAADLGLFLARLRRAHGKTGNADDARLLAQQVERFAGLGGQTDDPLRPLAHVTSHPFSKTSSCSGLGVVQPSSASIGAG